MQNRPTEKDEAVKILAAVEVENMLQKWFKDSAEEPEYDLKEVARYLIERPSYKNGYELAKDIESEFGFYGIDADLVETLDSVGYAVNKAVIAETKKWVEENKIVCPFPIGQKVMVKKDKEEGEVNKIYEGEAKVCVFMPQKGHVREGTGSHGCVYKYEDVEPVVC